MDIPANRADCRNTTTRMKATPNKPNVRTLLRLPFLSVLRLPKGTLEIIKRPVPTVTSDISHAGRAIPAKTKETTKCPAAGIGNP